MANADTDRNDLQREIGALTARVRAGAGAQSTPAPPLALVGANTVVIPFVVVQLMGFDKRLDGVEQRLTAVEESLDGVDARLARIEDALATLLER